MKKLKRSTSSSRVPRRQQVKPKTSKVKTQAVGKRPRMGSLQSRFPAAEQLKVYKQQKDGRRIPVRSYNVSDLPKGMDVETFASKYLAPGTYEFSVVTKNGKELGVGEVQVAEPSPKPTASDPVEQLKGIAEMSKILGEGQDVLEWLRGKHGTDDMKKSLDNIGMLLNAVGTIKKHTEEQGGAAAGFFDALGALFANPNFAGTIGTAIREKMANNRMQAQDAPSIPLPPKPLADLFPFPKFCTAPDSQWLRCPQPKKLCATCCFNKEFKFKGSFGEHDFVSVLDGIPHDGPRAGFKDALEEILHPPAKVLDGPAAAELSSLALLREIPRLADAIVKSKKAGLPAVASAIAEYLQSIMLWDRGKRK